jgi:hypothetical protein
MLLTFRPSFEVAAYEDYENYVQISLGISYYYKLQ